MGEGEAPSANVPESVQAQGAPVRRDARDTWRDRARRVRRWLQSPNVKATVQAAEYIAKIAAVVSIIVSGWTYIAGKADRDEAKYRDAWQVINEAHGQPGAGGRVHALEVLAQGRQRLDGVSVSGAFLEAVHLEGATLVRADFRRADLAHAHLRSVSATEANFSYADLTMADFSDAMLNSAKFTGSYALWDGPEYNAGGLSFAHAQLVDADFSGVQFWNADFSSATINVVRPGTLVLFERSELPNAKFIQANVSNASFERARLHLSTFARATLHDVSFVNACLSGVDFTGATLSDVEFSGANISGARLRHARLAGSTAESLKYAESSSIGGACARRFKGDGPTAP
jgi:uncharacterized protein YjbI with pentapeptide repeats